MLCNLSIDHLFVLGENVNMIKFGLGYIQTWAGWLGNLDLFNTKLLTEMN